MTLSILDEIVKYLEQHENSKRIKKLIFFACKNEWENDQETLDRFKLQELIQELSSLNPTLDDLTSSLSIAVKNISKPKQYSIIASIIAKELQKLYLISNEETGIILNPPDGEETGIILNSFNEEEETGIKLNSSNQTIPVLSNPQKPPSNQNIPVLSAPKKPSSNSSIKAPSSPKKPQHNQFDLRQNIMRYTNPLRVKIILFSALYRKFSFNEEDWLKLKAEQLDSLLRKLFDSCATFGEFESKINNAVISLGNPSKNTQASGVIIKTMRALYSDISVTANSYKPPNSSSQETTRPPVNSNYQSIPTEIDDLYDDDDDDNNTCQITVPPI